jgi:hypothetical protein
VRHSESACSLPYVAKNECGFVFHGSSNTTPHNNSESVDSDDSEVSECGCPTGQYLTERLVTTATEPGKSAIYARDEVETSCVLDRLLGGMVPRVNHSRPHGQSLGGLITAIEVLLLATA